jgi:hypothetical protein
MTAHQIAQLNGLLARATAERRIAGDHREPGMIAGDVLNEIGMPDLKLVLQRLRRRVRVADPNPAPAASSN